ncbi:LOW QUALITY PROTEIN: myelin protein zero-like protein 1 [Trichechus inunguis]
MSGKLEPARAWRWGRGLAGSGWAPSRELTAGVSALEVYTPKEIFVANGTQGKLTCKFNILTGPLTSVSWSFPERFFHYSQGREYLGDYLPFKGRTRWAGDLDKKDTSINIENMQFIHGNYICDVKPSPDIVVQPEHIRFHVSLPMFPVWVVVSVVSAVVLGVTLLSSMILAVLYRRKNSKQDYTGLFHLGVLGSAYPWQYIRESLSLVKQAPQKSSSDTEGLVKSLPAASHQCPVTCVQLDHSGGHHSNRINKLESVVYADIRKN